MAKKNPIIRAKKLRKKGKTYAQVGRAFNRSSFFAFSLLNRDYTPKKYRRKK